MKLPSYRLGLKALNPEEEHRRISALIERKRQDPDSVEQPLDALQSIAARLTEEMVAELSCAWSYSIARLTDDPATVLSHLADWPTHDEFLLGIEQATATYCAWLIARAQAVGGAWEAATRWRPAHGAPASRESQALWRLISTVQWPYPIGKQCPLFRDGSPMEVARDLMPFEDDGYAALVVTVDTERQPVTLFFMAGKVWGQVLYEGEYLPRLDPAEGAGGAIFQWGLNGSSVRITPPRPRQCGDLTKNARRWWKSVAGGRLTPGRPAGTRKRAPRDLFNELMDFKVVQGPIPPSEEEFFEAIGLSSTQLHRLTGDWEISWPEIVRAVYGDARHRRRHIARG